MPSTPFQAIPLELTQFSFKYDIPSLLRVCEDILIISENIPLLARLTLSENYRLKNLQEHVFSELIYDDSR